MSAAVRLGVYSGPESQTWMHLSEALCKYANIRSLALKGAAEAEGHAISVGCIMQILILTRWWHEIISQGIFKVIYLEGGQ